MRRSLRVGLSLIVVLVLAAIASYLTTSIIWDGGFPSGVFRLKVIDTNGEPVKGAVLRVYHGGTRDLAFEYPIDNQLPGQELTSDSEGVIVATRKNGGFQFGGHAWWLFWLIRLGDKAPEYDCEITAAGFRPLRFSIWQLFKSPYTSYAQFPKTKVQVEGKEIELKSYENIVTLER